MTHPTWDQEKIKVNSKEFDFNLYEQRRNYLLKLDDKNALTLSVEEQYDRIRFLREQEASNLFCNQRSQENHVKVCPNEKIRHKQNLATKKIYRDWYS